VSTQHLRETAGQGKNVRGDESKGEFTDIRAIGTHGTAKTDITSMRSVSGFSIVRLAILVFAVVRVIFVCIICLTPVLFLSAVREVEVDVGFKPEFIESLEKPEPISGARSSGCYP
jgi:hypothetical protein